MTAKKEFAFSGICSKCGHKMQTGEWPFCPHGQTRAHDSAVHQKERAVKFFHPEHGWRTPGRADRPMPGRLQKLGFQTVEFDSLQSLQKHGKEVGARSEVLDFDRGSGHAENQYG